MEGLGVLLFVAFVIARRVIEAKKEQEERRRRQAEWEATFGTDSVVLPPGPPGAASPTTATQQEGARLEDLFAELRRSLEEAQQVKVPAPPPPTPAPALPAPTASRSPRRLGRAPDHALEDDEAIEDAASLEGDPVVVSMEGQAYEAVVRQAPDRRAEAEAIERRRRAVAAEHERALTAQDHATFDARVRAAEPTPEARRSRLAQARQAMIWSEILAPPVSMRERGPGA